MTRTAADSSSQSWLPTRDSLLQRLRDVGDQTGWRDFFDCYWRLIYSVARKSGLGDAAAQDVVQETFLYLTRRMPNFQYDRGRGSFKSWLRVVTRSRISVLQRRHRGDALAKDPLPAEEGLLEAMPDPAGELLDELWQREWEQNLADLAMQRVRGKVSARQLLIFRLATQGELSPGQVARKLDVSVAQVYLARHRVGRLLKNEVRHLRKETE